MYQAPTAPQNVGGVLDNGFALFRVSIGVVFVLAVISGLISAPFERLAQAVVAGEPGLGAYALALAMGIVVMVLSTLFTAAIVWLIDRIGAGDRPRTSEAFAVGLRRVPALIGAGILYVLAVTVGLVLLILPGIFAGVALMFFFTAIIVDGKGAIAGLQYSWQLVRGNWWRTAGLALIIMVVLLLLYLVIGIVVGIVVALGTDAVLEEGQLPWYVDFIVTPLITGVVAPLAYALFLSVYGDLKLRREGGDVAERPAAVEA